MNLFRKFKIRKIAKILCQNNNSLDYKLLLKLLENEYYYNIAKNISEGKRSFTQNYFLKYDYNRLISGYNKL